MTGTVISKNFSNPELKRLSDLADNLRNISSLEEKIMLLNADPIVKEFLKTFSLNPGLSIEKELVIKAVIAAGQGERLTNFENLLDQLIPVERFYREIGGIVGYQALMLKLLRSGESIIKEEEYLKPDGIDISEENDKVNALVMQGIIHLPQLAEIYPLGGAADRLKLFDPSTGAALPAACLRFKGKTLLEGLVEDVQAREYVHFKLFGQQVTTPIAMMTSLEKEDHDIVRSICEEKNWFGRGAEYFKLLCQPSVPTLDETGNWCLQESMKLLLKPGGHGVIWKLFDEEKVFEWFEKLGRSKALVRQINNPIAGIDYGIFAFTGLGCSENKLFGFASCPCRPHAKEGINVLIKRKNEYSLTNIEYCDFQKYQIDEDQFTANTNVLFVDLKTIEKTVSLHPFPGKIVNFKKIGNHEIARLETMMQNIADFLTYESPDELETFITFNKRRKTISAAKQAYVPGTTLLETPEGCFLDHMENMRELLSDKCHLEIPKSFICFYHPALGPLFSIIAQKIKKGHLSHGSELQLEIADLMMENIDLKGSLFIRAENIMGHHEGTILKYSHQTGKCYLKNVSICNEGVDYNNTKAVWKNEIRRKECCSIYLEGCSEFFAENLTLKGNLAIYVKSGSRVTAYEKEGMIHFKEEAIDNPTWSWNYSINENTCELKKTRTS